MLSYLLRLLKTLKANLIPCINNGNDLKKTEGTSRHLKNKVPSKEI
jgi:hypothetical protein